MNKVNSMLFTLIFIAFALIGAALYFKSLTLTFIGFSVFIIAIVNDIKQCNLYRKNNPNCSPWDFL